MLKMAIHANFLLNVWVQEISCNLITIRVNFKIYKYYDRYYDNRISLCFI